MATDKIRVSTYIDQKLKELAQIAATYHSRSLSNYIEHLIKQDVARAVRDNEIENE
ncbi:MAG: hypothetical protein KME64_01515 [Scytonematopsis contorta HA4267-MV1]|jgi:hypothetical protein|nr:hypothetical protein [Scytonematopsis contorta HA4267-MV1]